MSMLVHFRPLPPNDGALVPLDLHDPGIRQYRFENIYTFIERDGCPPLCVSLIPDFPVCELASEEGHALFLTRDGLWVEYRVINWTDHHRMERDNSGLRLVQVNDIEAEYRQVNPGYVAALFHAAEKPIVAELRPHADMCRVATFTHTHEEYGVSVLMPDPYAPLDGGNQAPVPSGNGTHTQGVGSAATNDRNPEAPADRIELAAAAPSGDGTAATGGTPLAGSGRSYLPHDLEPYRDSATSPATNCPALEAPVAGPLVILGEPGDQPIVNGKIKPRLTLARYHIIDTLIDAAEKGLTGDELVNKSGHGGAVNTLKAMARDRDWGAVIQLPGSPGGRYRIVSRLDGH